ncbi:hypothetical protein BH23ACT9_BH23ACT9_31190 [soil metagenome]
MTVILRAMERGRPIRRLGFGERVGLAARRVVVTVIGSVIIIAGVIMMVTPGPGLVAVAAGLAVLAREYDWAKRALVQVRQRSRAASERARGRVRSSHDGRRDASTGRETEGTARSEPACYCRTCSGRRPWRASIRSSAAPTKSRNRG